MYALPDEHSRFFHVSFSALLAVFWGVSYDTQGKYKMKIPNSELGELNLSQDSHVSRRILMELLFHPDSAAMDPHKEGQRREGVQRRLWPWSFSFSRYEVQILHKYDVKRDPVFAGQKLHQEYLRRLPLEQRRVFLQKTLIAGLDPGKRSTFTLMYFFVLLLLKEEDPKLCSKLALNFSFGRHVTLSGEVPHYDFC